MNDFKMYFMQFGGPVGIGLIIMGLIFYFFVLRSAGAIMTILGIILVVLYYYL